eukprot:9346834-Pyramimonas_sp.AAC.1
MLFQTPKGTSASVGRPSSLFAGSTVHSMVAYARVELAKAEAAARATMDPNGLLRSAKDRFAVKEAERDKQK